MKKLIISGSASLNERSLYWAGYFAGQGYEVIDYPTLVTDDPNDGEATPTPGDVRYHVLDPNDIDYASHYANCAQRFWRNLDEADVFFLMNEDKDGVEGYIGYGAMVEMGHILINNHNLGKKTEIYLLKEPNPKQSCYQEVKFWLDQGWVKVYEPGNTKTPLLTSEIEEEPEVKGTTKKSIVSITAPKVSANLTAEFDQGYKTPTSRLQKFFSGDRTINLLTSKHHALKKIPMSARQLLQIYCPEFPAWLLKYIDAPEMQRLANVSMVTMDYSSIYNFEYFSSVLAHSIGAALIVWNFTHDRKQTLAELFHDIAAPSFKHAVDYFNGDSEHQESIETQTGQIIRSSKVITKQLKKDGILPGEVSDYKLYSIADNEVPGLAADRLEYTFSNGYFLYETWNLNDIKRFYEDITIFENEEGLDELGFKTPALAAEFTRRNLPLSTNYHSAAGRASLQFIADILRLMTERELITTDDLYTMSERDIVEWILSCGDEKISEAFRNFQRTTSAFSSNTIKRNCYCTDSKSKIRYIIPLTRSHQKSGEESVERIIDIDEPTELAVTEYLSKKQPKYVGFDFEFNPKK